MQGSETISGVEVGRYGQIDTNMRDMVNFESVAASGGPSGLGFLSTRGQEAMDIGPVPRICQWVLSWESLECSIPQSQVQGLVRHLSKSPSEPGGTCYVREKW